MKSVGRFQLHVYIYMRMSDPRHPPHRSPRDPPACAEVLDVCSLHRGASEVRGR